MLVTLAATHPPRLAPAPLTAPGQGLEGAHRAALWFYSESQSGVQPAASAPAALRLQSCILFFNQVNVKP